MLAGSTARAQESASSSIIGTVVDSTQGALPGATITVTQVGTGAQRTVVADSDGRFSVPGLRAATYDIHVELSGFSATTCPEPSTSAARASPPTARRSIS
jgi:hypothetical protein